MQFRLQTWQIIGSIFEHEGHLLRGLGIGAFYVFAPQYGFPVSDPTQDLAIFHAHNLYLDIVVQFGIIGLLIYLYLISRNLIRLWRGYRRSFDQKFRYLHLGIFCGLTAFYVHGFMDLGLAMPDWWLFLGLATAVPLVVNRVRSSATG
jgi:O-antigen ligase